MEVSGLIRLAGVLATLGLGTLMLIQGGIHGQVAALAAAALAAPTALVIWFRAGAERRWRVPPIG
ncbi:MAG TPA: hypothetical protein VE990_03205 [Acidimicrobiales bacterium]|nr:hypothetical protein [Acidimicrobiales bacterium]